MTRFERGLAFDEFLDDLAVLGVTPQGSGGICYAVIKARSNERWWLVPLNHRKAAAAGLEMLQPVTLTARLAKSLVRASLQFGPRALWQARTCLSNMPTPAVWFPENSEYCAYFTGTNGPHRKTAIQFLDKNGSILGFTKISRHDHIRTYIRNEAATLAELATMDMKSVDIPKLIHHVEKPGFSVLTTDSRKMPGYQTLLGFTVYHQKFLEELRQKTSIEGAGALLCSMEADIASLGNAVDALHRKLLDDVLHILRPLSKTIEVGLAHGDFTPWNSFVQSGRLYVFDWEYATHGYPVGFDFVHFHLATIGTDRQQYEAKRLRDGLKELFFQGDKEVARRALLLSLALHAVFYLRRQFDAGEPVLEWTDAPGRFALIRNVIHLK